jgi:hypothetical protein
MKRMSIAVCTAFIALSAFVVRSNVATAIHGTVTPPEGAKKVWAINGTDSVWAVPAGGSFSFDVKPGTWKLQVEAAAPYKNATIENIVVEEGKSVDAGEIKLTQ